MKRRIWMVAPVICAAGILAAICWPQPQPSYQGKSLSAWLRDFESPKPEARWQAADAVRHIGTNALPLLTARLQHLAPKREPRWRTELRFLLSKQSIVKFDLPYPANQRVEALAALDALGPAAKSSIPSLEKLLHENPPDTEALLVLARIGSDAVPVLTRALTNDTKVIRQGARICLEMLQSHAHPLFPKTAQDAEFMRRTCEFNLLMLHAAFEDYRAQHLGNFGPGDRPPPRTPPDFTPSRSP